MGRKAEGLPEPAGRENTLTEPHDRIEFDALAEALLQMHYCVADVLPEQVPQGAAGQYFAVERWYMQPERLLAQRRKFAAILLRLNCYDRMAASFDGGESWETNPDPASFAARLAALEGKRFLRALFPGQRCMIDVQPDDTYMTGYALPPDFRARLEKLAFAEGLFVWDPPGQD